MILYDELMCLAVILISRIEMLTEAFLNRHKPNAW